MKRFSEEIIKSIPIGIIVTDSSGFIISINTAAERLLKIKGNRVVGRSIYSLGIGEEISNLISTQKKWLISRINAQEFLISKSTFLSKQQIKVVYTFQDLSELDVSWIQQYCNLDAIIEGSYDGIIVTTYETILRVNNSFLRISGLRKEEIEGKSILQLANSSHICLKAIYEISKLVKQKKTSVTIMRKMRSGHEIYVTGAFVKCGGREYCIINIRDITELQHLKEQVSRLTALYLSIAEDNQFTKLIGDDIVIESPAMKRLVELILRVAQTDSTILIQGESGTGKEVLAKLIHNLSPRNKGPFIAINCGAIPESLLESELFGYEKGAFTGAIFNGKPGLFEMAQGGIIFLDEIGEMPLNIQVKFLRVLQDMHVYRLGSIKPVKLDVRIIVATNRNLQELVKEGKFREDLFYRLYVIPVEIPPLRARPEDIFPLANHFLKKYNQKYEQVKRFSPELIKVFESYHWPGNVRELQNIIERLVVTTDAEVLRPDHLPHYFIINKKENFYENINTIDTNSLQRAKEHIERTMLVEALQAKQTTREIARLLGVNHSTVVRKIKKYGLR
ncbi:MAG: sigma 54-interacting transcriptional regulator [Thermoplasmata archaeon]